MGLVIEKGRDEKEICIVQEQREPSTHTKHILETNTGTQRARAFTRFLWTQIRGTSTARSEGTIHSHEQPCEAMIYEKVLEL